jgi:hypothetical protein
MVVARIDTVSVGNGVDDATNALEGVPLIGILVWGAIHPVSSTSTPVVSIVAESFLTWILPPNRFVSLSGKPSRKIIPVGSGKLMAK